MCLLTVTKAMLLTSLVDMKEALKSFGQGFGDRIQNMLMLSITKQKPNVNWVVFIKMM